MSAPLFLDEAQTLLFTGAGTYFRTGDVRFAGRLTGVTNMSAFNQCADADEAIALQFTANNYGAPMPLPSAYLRFQGSQYLPQPAMMLPQIGCQTSYGLGVFHTHSCRHVALVQTGSDQPLGAGAAYFVVLR